MTWEIFVGITVLVAFIISTVTPILKLNSSITKLNCSIDQLNKNMATTERRIDIHGKEIDELKNRTTQIDSDVKALEKKVDYLHHN